MKLSRMCLKITGVWPNSERSDLFACVHYAAVAGYLFLTVVLLQFIKLIIIWGDVDAMSNILAYGLLFYVVAFVKMTSLWYYRKSMLFFKIKF